MECPVCGSKIQSTDDQVMGSYVLEEKYYCTNCNQYDDESITGQTVIRIGQVFFYSNYKGEQVTYDEHPSGEANEIDTDWDDAVSQARILGAVATPLVELITHPDPRSFIEPFPAHWFNGWES